LFTTQQPHVSQQVSAVIARRGEEEEEEEEGGRGRGGEGRFERPGADDSPLMEAGYKKM